MFDPLIIAPCVTPPVLDFARCIALHNSSIYCDHNNVISNHLISNYFLGYIIRAAKAGGDGIGAPSVARSGETHVDHTHAS